MFEGLGKLANLGSMLKQAQQMGGRLQQLSEELKAKRAEGTAGGGLVTVEVNGLGEVLACRIDPSLVTSGDRELIEDLLVGDLHKLIWLYLEGFSIGIAPAPADRISPG